MAMQSKTQAKNKKSQTECKYYFTQVIGIYNILWLRIFKKIIDQTKEIAEDKK